MSHPQNPQDQDPTRRMPRLEHDGAQPYQHGQQYPPHPSGQDQFSRPWPGDGRGEEPPRTYGGFTRVDPPRKPTPRWVPWVCGTVVLLAILGSCGGGQEEAAPEPVPAVEQATQAPEPVQTVDAPAEPTMEEKLDQAFLEKVATDIPGVTGLGLTDQEILAARDNVCAKLDGGQTQEELIREVVMPISAPEDQASMAAFLGASVGWSCKEHLDGF